MPKHRNIELQGDVMDFILFQNHGGDFYVSGDSDLPIHCINVAHTRYLEIISCSGYELLASDSREKWRVRCYA